MINNPLFIAEVKTESPFGFKSEYSWEDLLGLAINHGDIIAVHTDPRWGGGFDRLETAAKILSKVGYPERKYPNREKPLLLAKGIHQNDEEIRDALDCGADLVLVVGRVPPRKLEPACIFEPRDFTQLVSEGRIHHRIMWNQRDLETGECRHQTFDKARSAHLGWLCQASFIKTPDDVSPRANAFVVGENLPNFIENRIRLYP